MTGSLVPAKKGVSLLVIEIIVHSLMYDERSVGGPEIAKASCAFVGSKSVLARLLLVRRNERPMGPDIRFPPHGGH